MKYRLAESRLTGVKLSISEQIEPHVGLGSKTATVLACVEAAFLALGRRPNRAELVQVSGRGGASGIGVNAYFEGGLIGDFGHAMEDTEHLLPSSGRSSVDIPGVAFRSDWPNVWPVVLARPLRVVGLHGNEELAFFERNTPLDRAECALSAMALHFELPAAIRTQDFDGLRLALWRSRQAGFKEKEIAAQPRMAEVLARLDCVPEMAATMSSFGPTLMITGSPGADIPRLLDDCGIDDEWIVSFGQVSKGGRQVDVMP